MAKLHCHLDDAPYADCDQAHGANPGHDLLDVGHAVGGAQQRGGAAEEGLEPGGVDQAVALTLQGLGCRGWGVRV